MIRLVAAEGMFVLELHESLWEGLITAGAVVRGVTEITAYSAALLDRWADGCENPSGQRANLARGIARLAAVSPLAVDVPAPAAGGTFWDRAQR